MAHPGDSSGNAERKGGRNYPLRIAEDKTLWYVGQNGDALNIAIEDYH
jgi:hypothetical protein